MLVGFHVTVPNLKVSFFDPLRCCFQFVLEVFYIILLSMTLYDVFFLYQTHYVWMYDIFMLKSQAAKYFSKMLKKIHQRCLDFLLDPDTSLILARTMLIVKITPELFNPVVLGHVTA